jgi:hypothetical protein
LLFQKKYVIIIIEKIEKENKKLMKLLQTTYEYRAYSEEEAKNFIESFRQEAKEKGYTVKSAGWTHKEKTKSKVVVAEAWVVKCVAIFDTVWDEGEGENG